MRRQPPPASCSLPRGPSVAGAPMSERLSKPTCLIVASAAAAGVSADSFLHSFTLASSAFNLQVATPGGKSIDFVGVNEANMRWIQDFRMKSYANPAKLESTDGARYHALLIPDCPGAMTDLANSGYLARILQHFSSENKPVCAVGHGVAALCCATTEDKSWVFQGYSLTGPAKQMQYMSSWIDTLLLDRMIIPLLPPSRILFFSAMEENDEIRLITEMKRRMQTSSWFGGDGYSNIGSFVG
ncbi:glutamine amidotransferase-like class 1 domain-containing protein 1 isoform X3 [Tiliqua scincoides]|uniref:glutamine amidotransferase-like class 1 domain-containing protein 1 isoform X3 n=1 Tax=Tiliqua scincoides TaxID=71010 RepID=UPI0034630BAE